MPEDPAKGRVWSAVVAQTDLATSESEFISTEDTLREALARHPWNIGGGGAAEVQKAIEEDRLVLAILAASVGITSFTLEDDLFLLDERSVLRKGIEPVVLRPSLLGDDVRDWSANTEVRAVFPYDSDFKPLARLPRFAERHMWMGRTCLANNKMFGGRTKVESGLEWFEFGRLTADKLRTPLTITFAFVATHNHFFVLDRGGKVFNRSAPVIKFPAKASEDDHLGLLGLLNSSVACFWMKQVFYPKGGDHVGQQGARVSKTLWEDRYEYTGTGLERFPVTDDRPLDLARPLDTAAQRLAKHLPASLCAHVVPSRAALDAARVEAEATRARMIALQEELDWRCYRLYGLLEDAPGRPNPPPLRLGERAFEIVKARRMAAGELETTWFERHRSTPITELPAHWPGDYRAVVELRIRLIESDPTIGLIERPEYKRRWSAPTWEEMEQDALSAWLLDRLEDARFWPAGDPRILSVRAVTDSARHDADFLAVAELFAGRAAFDLDALVSTLVAGKSVPFLAAFRYTETGLRKRTAWEATWEKQRAEDAIDAELAARRNEFLRAAWSRMNPLGDGERPEDYARRMAAGLNAEDVRRAADAAIAAEARRRKQDEVGDIPVPPKYKNADFQSQDFWRLRGGLDVPKERFVSFPHCARDADPSLPVLWAGYDHLARARAIAAWYVDRKETDGWPPERLKPLLAGLLELVPWLRQWHNDIEPETGLRMGDSSGATSRSRPASSG